MNPISPDALLNNLNWRYATKTFDAGRKIPEHHWSALVQSAQLAPSSFGLSPWKFIVINDPALRTQLKAHSWNQPQITDASHLVVFARKTSMTKADVEHYINRIAEVRGVPKQTLEGYQGMMNGFLEKPAPGFDVNQWTAKQVYIALGFFLSAAAMLGIDSCPMEGFSAAEYDKALGLTAEGYASTVVAVAGYRSADDKSAHYKKVRPPEREVVKRIG